MSTARLLERLEGALNKADQAQMWLALAVISGELPSQPAVLRAVRIARLDGPLVALAELLSVPTFPPKVPGRAWPTVRVITRRVMVDVHDTARTEVATGIQRVARQTVRRWDRDHQVVLIGWSDDDKSLRELSTVEKTRLLGRPPSEPAPRPPDAEVIVPWQCTYLLPELIAEPNRNRRLQSLLHFSGNVGASIGFDLVPLTSAETTADGMGEGFSTGLAAATHMQRIATISDAAAIEYRGWRHMLTGTGYDGPHIRAVRLATEAAEPSAEGARHARSELTIPGLPMVLCVGSHEPRKNHLAVLHAAELLWRERIEFSLLFVGGNAWRDERFLERVAELQAAGRPLISVRALPDDQLWGAYRLAHCVIFPSLNEGFGLPIAESLASGTPVITSRFGSMHEIAAQGGAILVDPRDDHDIAEALRRILTTTGLRERLAEQARALPVRTWDQYAADAWDYLVNGAYPTDAQSA
jgi:glycosyltransferase involved in cell wall biosynthesis